LKRFFYEKNQIVFIVSYLICFILLLNFLISMKLYLTLIISIISFTSFSQPIIELHTAIKNSPRDKNLIELYRKLGNQYKRTKLDSAIYAYNEGIKVATEINNTNLEALLLGEIGTAYEFHNNLFLAEKYLRESLTLLIALKENKSIAIAQSTLGVIEGKRGNFIEATKYFFSALEFFKNNNDTTDIVSNYVRLGVVNELNNYLDRAFEYYNKALEINPKDTTSNMYFTLLNNIGIVYAKKGNMKEAIAYFEKGIINADKPELIGIYLTLLNNCMQAYGEIGEKQKSMYYNKIALQKARLNNNAIEEARALYNYASVNWKINYDFAITYLKSALEILKKIENKGFEADIYLLLSEINKEKGNYIDAYSYLTKHNNIKDILFNKDKARVLSDLFADYEFKDSKAKINELVLTNEKTIHQRNIGIIAVSASLIILILLGYYYRRVSLLKDKLQVSNTVKDKLFSIIGHDLRTPSNAVAQGLNLLSEAPLNNEDRKQLLSSLQNQSKVIVDVLNSLLNWGETQLKGIKIAEVSINILPVINKSIDLLKSISDAKQLQITVNVSKEINVFSDKNHFEFIIRNLLSNAVKYTKTNGTIEIAAHENLTKETILISIKDNGKGITKEQQLQFLKSNMDVTFGSAGEKGTGIGLLLTKEFVLANKGKIWLESEENIGTTFYVELPSNKK